MAGIDVEKCVTLGDYKGVTVEKTIQSVTDEDVQNEIDNDAGKLSGGSRPGCKRR